jgi:hypothetical protein
MALRGIRGESLKCGKLDENPVSGAFYLRYHSKRPYPRGIQRVSCVAAIDSILSSAISALPDTSGVLGMFVVDREEEITEKRTDLRFNSIEKGAS